MTYFANGGDDEEFNLSDKMAEKEELNKLAQKHYGNDFDGLCSDKQRVISDLYKVGKLT